MGTPREGAAPPAAEAPRCRWCNSTMAKYTYYVSQRPHDTLAVRPTVGATFRQWPEDERGLMIQGVRESPVTQIGRSWRLWCGEWGYEGNGYFCTLTCAYKFACRVIKDGLADVRYTRKGDK